MTMQTYTQFKKDTLKKSRVRAAYDALGPEFEVITSLIKRRLQKGFTQGELAERIGMKQSAIARLESGSYNPSLDLLKKVTHALDVRVTITSNRR